MKWLIATACGYEVAAITSAGRAPTISELCSRRRVLAPVVLGCLAMHLYRYTPPQRLGPPGLGRRQRLGKG